VFIGPLPNNGHANRIENTSCTAGSVVCEYLGRCFEMGLHVTIWPWIPTGPEAKNDFAGEGQQQITLLHYYVGLSG
jgi:hypothetical protein